MRSFIGLHDMNKMQQKWGCGAVGGCVLLLLVVGVVVARFLSGNHEAHPENPPSNNGGGSVSVPTVFAAQSGTAPNAALPSSTPIPPLALSDLTESDWPPAVKVTIPVEFPFKSGDAVVVKDKAPVFFYNAYIGDASPGQRFEVLKFDPKTSRVYCKSKDKYGKTIAVNILKVHLVAKASVTVPAGIVVSCNGVDGDAVLVGYSGGAQIVPVNDTDLLLMAAQQRAKQGAAREEQAEEEQQRSAQAEQEQQDAAKQAQEEAQRRKSEEKAVARDQAGDEPEVSAWDGSVTAVKNYLQQTVNDPDIQYVSWFVPQLKKIDGSYYWIVKVRFRAKNPFGAYMLHDYGYMIQKVQVVQELDLDALGDDSGSN